MALPDGRSLAELELPAPPPPPPGTVYGRRFITAEGLAAHLDLLNTRFAEVIAALRANPPTGDADLARIGGVAEGVERAVSTLDRACGWREER